MLHNVVPLRVDGPPLHPLLGLHSAYHLHAKQSLDAWVLEVKKGRWKREFVRWLIREIHARIGFSGDFKLHEMGTVTSLDVARAIVAQKNLECKALKPGQPGYGFVWEFKESSINKVYPYGDIEYGRAEYSATTIDDHLKARKPTDLVDCQAVKDIRSEYLQVDAAIERTVVMARKAAAAATRQTVSL